MSIFDDVNAEAESARSRRQPEQSLSRTAGRQTQVGLYARLGAQDQYPLLLCGRGIDGCVGVFGYLVKATGYLYLDAGWREHGDHIWRLRDPRRRQHRRTTARQRNDPEQPNRRTPTRLREERHVIECPGCRRLNVVDLKRLSARTDADDRGDYAAMYGPMGAVRALGLPQTLPPTSYPWRLPGRQLKPPV
jgi:hypothetical protein